MFSSICLCIGQCRPKIGFKLLMRRNKILVLKCRVNPEAVGFTGIRACGSESECEPNSVKAHG